MDVSVATFPTPIAPGKTRLGWIGTGIIGAAMASHLLSFGYALTVFNRTPSKATQLLHFGATLAPSPSVVASFSDVVFLMVGAPSDVQSLVLDYGFLPSLPPGGIIVDMTSSSPALAREITSDARYRSCWAVNAPASGGDTGTKKGKLAIFVGSDTEVVRLLSPLLELKGKTTHVGEARCGQSFKIANQITVARSMLGLSEVLVFTKEAGLDVEGFFRAMMSGSARTNVGEIFDERTTMRDFEPGGFAEYMVKDLRMALEGFGGGEIVALSGTSLCGELIHRMVGNRDGGLALHNLVTVIEGLQTLDELALAINVNLINKMGIM